MLINEEFQKLDNYLKKIVNLEQKCQEALKAFEYFKPKSKEEKETMSYITQSFKSYIIFFNLIVNKVKQELEKIQENKETKEKFEVLFNKGDMEVIKVIESEFNDLTLILTKLIQGQNQY